MTRHTAIAQSRAANGPNNAMVLERRASLGPHLTVQRDTPANLTTPVGVEVRHVVESPGHPLDSGTRGQMEARFGYDLSSVRLHTGNEAADSARALSANAYTSGANIVFGDGQYAPGSSTGRRLLVHELTHVIQQRTGPVAITPAGPDLAISSPNDRFEKRASAEGEGLASGAGQLESAPASSVEHGATETEALPIQRDFLGLSGDAWGGIGALAGGAALALGVLAYLRPPEALNPAPVTGGLSLNPNPFSFNSMASPVPEPPSNRNRYMQALRGRPQERKILDLNTDDDNHVAVNLALKTDGYNILDASVRTGDTRGYLGGSRGSSATLSFSSTLVPTGGAANFFTAQEPGTPTPQNAGSGGGPNTQSPSGANSQLPTPANAPPQAGATGASPQPQNSPAGSQSGSAPTQNAASEPAEAILTFTGANAKNQGNPQNFAGQVTVKGDGSVRCDDIATTNGVGRAEVSGEYGVVDYRTQTAGRGGSGAGSSLTPSEGGGRFDPGQLLPFGRPMT
jgi:hypothetical protein